MVGDRKIMNSDKILVGPINKGLRTDREPFDIDSDSFPVLINAYQWRGRVRRKRGTKFLNRLTRFFNSNLLSYTATATIPLDVSGIGNLITGYGLQTNAAITPGSVTLVGSVGAIVYTDPTKDGYLTPSGTGGPNTINYATGEITIPAQANGTVTSIIEYYPNLPVMGVEDLAIDPSDSPNTMLFDTVYSYEINSNFPYPVHDVSFYKNPSANPTTLPGYTPKNDPTPTTWNGEDYQQFWVANYQNALWATNGIRVPFTPSNIGMQFAPSIDITYVSSTVVFPYTITVTIINCPLVVGDFVYFNEWTGANAITLNFQTGYVIAVAGVPALLTVTVRFPDAILGAGVYTQGIIQYLTNRSNVANDNLKWYDGDPTNAVTHAFIQGKGWVNFMPPISLSNFSISNLTASQYYLVGARLIIPYKDRLLFLGVVVQTSTGLPIYLPDTVIYSQNGTPYYTASFTGDPTLATTIYSSVLVPANNSATASAYWSDQTGFGGFLPAGIASPIISVGTNEDVLIVGFSSIQSKIVYTGNDLQPFNFYQIDSELPTSSTFSAVNMGNGIISRGERGLVRVTQREATRIDLDILDQMFQINLLNNGNERFTAQRDFLNEWIYFTYRGNQNKYRFPTQTLQYNYRDNSWAIFDEAYTTYGQFRQKSGFTWSTIGQTFPTWNSWNVAWNAGETTELTPDVCAGNQQGFLCIKDNEDGTAEGKSLYIQGINPTSIISFDHCLNEGDYIVISDVLGVSGLNGNIFKVANPTDDMFDLNPVPTISGTYLGGGLITRMYVPFIQTRQFPTAWSVGRKTRLGVQKYLLSKTDKGQIQLLIYLSTDASFPYNKGALVPGVNVDNASLIYSTTLFTCPESTNLGLTPANINLQMITNTSGTTGQKQIWHRINTSLIGDTIQLGFTLSDEQMRDTKFRNQFTEIELHAFILDVFASQLLC